MPARTASFVVLAALLPLAAALDPHRDVEGSLDRVEAALNLELEHVAPRTRRHLERWFPSLEKRALGYDPKTDALTAGTCSDETIDEVTACLESVKTCGDVFVNVEGSAQENDQRRRANSMLNMEYFAHTRRCAVFFADNVELKSSKKLLKPPAVQEKYGIQKECLLPTQKCAVKQMLKGLADADKRVLFMFSSHGGLRDKKAEGTYEGYGNYVVFGKVPGKPGEEDTEEDHITKSDIKEWIVGPFCARKKAVLVVVWSACFSGGYYASLKTKDGVKVKKSNTEIFNWWANNDDEKKAKLDNLSEIEVLMSPSKSGDAGGPRGGVCPGEDPVKDGVYKGNVVFYTSSFPHMSSVGRFDESSFGRRSKGTEYMGGNLMHTAFRMVVDKARAKLNSEGDVISEAARYNPIQMKLALQNELYNQTTAYLCDETFDLKCCETEERAFCTETVANLEVKSEDFTMAVTDELLTKAHAIKKGLPQVHGKKVPWDVSHPSPTHSYQLKACFVNVEDKCPASHPYPQDPYVSYGYTASKDAKWHLLEMTGFNFYPWKAGSDLRIDPYPVAGYTCYDPVNRKAAKEADYTRMQIQKKRYGIGKQNEESCTTAKTSDKPLFELLGFRSVNDCCASFLLATPSTYVFYAEDGLDDQQSESVDAWMTKIRETAGQCTAATEGTPYWKANGFGDAPLALGGISGLTDCILSKRLGDYKVADRW